MTNTVYQQNKSFIRIFFHESFVLKLYCACIRRRKKIFFFGFNFGQIKTTMMMAQLQLISFGPSEAYFNKQILTKPKLFYRHLKKTVDWHRKKNAWGKCQKKLFFRCARKKTWVASKCPVWSLSLYWAHNFIVGSFFVFVFALESMPSKFFCRQKKQNQTGSFAFGFIWKRYLTPCWKINYFCQFENKKFKKTRKKL